MVCLPQPAIFPAGYAPWSLRALSPILPRSPVSSPPSPSPMKLKSSTKNQAAGIAKTVAGKVKAATGKLVGNPRLEAAGKADQAEGRARNKLGQIERVLDQ